ncbi:MAG: VOC family protein [Cyanobacteria bacterium J06641_5]
MIAYTLIGTKDFQRSAAFYDALLAEVGGKRAAELDRIILYIGAEGTPFFGIAQPYDGQPATAGNGSMVGLAAKDPTEVDRLYAKAIDLGATDDGAPGPRTNKGLNFYAGYFRDPDGNKLNFFCMS